MEQVNKKQDENCNFPTLDLSESKAELIEHVTDLSSFLSSEIEKLKDADFEELSEILTNFKNATDIELKTLTDGTSK